MPMTSSDLMSRSRSLWQRLRPGRRASVHLENVLGTSLELHLTVADENAERRAGSAVLEEIERLSAILDQHSGASEIAAWQRTFYCDAVVSPELAEVLDLASMWQARTAGAFNPAAIALRGVSRVSPQFERLMDAAKQPLWHVDQSRGVARRLSVLPTSLDAIAKGYIVAHAAARAYDTPGVSRVLLNIGGDIQHFGSKPEVVGVAHPSTGAENGDLLATVGIQNEALATSGGYRRGIIVDGDRQSHIMSPHSGLPARGVASVSVIAPDCDSADALSTACSVLAPEESLKLVESMPGVGCLILDDTGRVFTNSEWDRHASLARR
jgi:thiamine biosynthesis lipoprotein